MFLHCSEAWETEDYPRLPLPTQPYQHFHPTTPPREQTQALFALRSSKLSGTLQPLIHMSSTGVSNKASISSWRHLGASDFLFSFSPALDFLFWFIFIRTFKKYFIYLFLERGGGREKNIGMWEKHQTVASHMASARDLAHNLGICPDLESNQWLFSLQDNVQSSEPHQPGLDIFFNANTSTQYVGR